MPDRDDDDSGLGFRLPPIRLPPFFSENFQLSFPIPGGRPRSKQASTSTVLVACLLFDLADAVLAVFFPGTIAGFRAVAGTFLASAVVGPLGLLYVWEVAAMLAGMEVLTVVPSLTVLFVLRVLRVSRVLRVLR